MSERRMAVSGGLCLAVALLGVAASASASASDVFKTGECSGEPRCRCKWSEGKRMADCSAIGLLQIPPNLSPDIQTLVLDYNYITGLGKDVFKEAGILNLQSISLRQCAIADISESAFRDLKILTSLDLSANNFTKLHPKTFDGNQNLKTLKLAQNPLSTLLPYQFPPLRNLRILDVSGCALRDVDRVAFKNLGVSVESLFLHANRLTTLRDQVLVPLAGLKTLTLHDNAWTCDCKLKSFRDYVIEKGLYTRQTFCQEPSRLSGFFWTDIKPLEFACKPEVMVPQARVFSSAGVDVELACFISGSPLPTARWVINGRIVSNLTHQQPDQLWLIREAFASADNMQRWYNLTIKNVATHDLGDYVCVGENEAGVMERTVSLTFDHPSLYETAGVLVTDEQVLILIGAGVAVGLLVLLLLVVCCCCCWCRRRRRRKAAPQLRSRASVDEDAQKLLWTQAAPPPKPPRHADYASLPQTDLAHNGYDFEMREQRAEYEATQSSDSSGIGFGHSDDVPDLLSDHHLRKSSLQHSLATLSRPLPTPSPTSSLQLNPVQLLPAPPKSRSVSCDHSQGLQPVAMTSRPGYVTLPRRPRTGWSLPKDLPSPGSHSLQRDDREPIYDGVGPRTSADGSSRACLHKPSPRSVGLLPYCAPIEEQHECPPTPRQWRAQPKSMLELSDLGGRLAPATSEGTLLEENISAYCEPFGTALPPPKEDSDAPKRAKPPPPKTLPKPKVKPVPPPKPKKSFAADSTESALISFRDESLDGSEV